MKTAMLLMALSLLTSCFRLFDCETYNLSKAVSPDGVYEATAFAMNCGATSPFTVHVFLGAKGDKVEEVGNVFRGTQSDKIAVRWKDNRTLEITTPAQVFLQMKEYSGVSFELVRETPKGQGAKR